VAWANTLARAARARVLAHATPLGLDKLKIDPAVTSTVFVTTMTDTFGFFFFLGLAEMFHLG